MAIVFAALVGCTALPPRCHGQALPTATGPGAYFDAGATASLYQADYGQNQLGGITAHVDANLTWRLGVEGEARYLRYHQIAETNQTTYLVGPRFVLRPTGFRPYVKFLAGEGIFNFPYNYATGRYFVMAPGAGVDWQLGNSRLIVRLVDFEYQDWTHFDFGPLHPYGVSAGISYRIFSGESRN